MNKFAKPFAIAVAGLSVATLSGCGGSGSDSDSGLNGESTGIFNLSISDGPIKDAAKVCIKFDGIELKPVDEAPFSIDFADTPEIVNLLANQGANSQPIVTNEQVPAGEYEWIRLKVDASRNNDAGSADSDPNDPNCLADDGSYLLTESEGHYSLFIPSGEQSGLKLIGDITVPANNSANYTAEWDLGKSFIAPPGLAPDALMKPVIKIVSNDVVGTLVGAVDDGLVMAETCDAEFAPSVYVFPNGVTPNPIDMPPADPDEPFTPPADDPLATGLVEQQVQDDQTMQYRYSIGFLEATVNEADQTDSPYVAAFTCDGETFFPVDGKDASIRIGEVTEVNFFLDDQPPSSGS